MMASELEKSLMYAGEDNDVESLKNLARQESARADRFQSMLSAVLRANGPTRIPQDSIDADNLTITLTADSDGSVVLRSVPSK